MLMTHSKIIDRMADLTMIPHNSVPTGLGVTKEQNERGLCCWGLEATPPTAGYLKTR